MNFIEEYKKGQNSGNKGLPMGEGLSNLSKHINGIQRARIYGIAAAPKAGKSTFVDYAFVIQPYLYILENPGIEVEWIYYSFELDRISKEFDFATYFLYHDYNVQFIKLPDGVTKGGQDTIELSPDYLRGRLIDDNGEVIKVKPEIFELIKQVYITRIIPLFGEFDSNGNLTKESKPLITFIEQKDNPTGIYKDLKKKAETEGSFIKSGPNNRIIGYKSRKPEKVTIIIMDHLRKLIPERGWQMKQTVDKMIEYMVELRNWCGYTFVPIIHTNRNLASVDRVRFAKQQLYPTSDDIKDTGNLAEDADFVFTMFNPNDDRYNLTEHFQLKLKDSRNNKLYPNLRTIHLVESRHSHFPEHFKVDMFGNYKNFKQVDIKTTN